MAKIKQFSDYKTIKTTRTEYTKVGSKWKLKDKKKYLMSEKQYNNFTDNRWARHMRFLGGYEKADKNYTARGYRVVRNTSISPDRDTKIVTQFDFDGSRKLYDRANENYYKQFRRKK